MQQQDASKNYIGIVSDTTEETCIADSIAQSQPRLMSYLTGRLSAMLRRHGTTSGRWFKS